MHAIVELTSTRKCGRPQGTAPTINTYLRWNTLDLSIEATWIFRAKFTDFGPGLFSVKFKIPLVTVFGISPGLRIALIYIKLFIILTWDYIIDIFGRI
jgi:hypothetical protein